MIASRPFLTAYSITVMFTLIAGDAWRYTIGWWGWTGLVIALTVIAVALLVRSRANWAFGGLPYPLLAFLVLAVLSTAWSFYPGATALGALSTLVTAVAGIALAVNFNWSELLSHLAVALRFILGLSILFELYVSAIVKHPILPLVPEPGIDYSHLGSIPKMLYWSRDELFQVLHGGKIQGILGNSVLLSFAALLGIVVLAIQFGGRTAKKRWSLPWLVLSIACLAMSRSATIIVATAVVVVVAGAVLLVRRARNATARGVTYAGFALVLIIGVTVSLVFKSQVLAILGKSEDLTNRADIWEKVIHLAQQRPVFGWGWVSYWVPWVAPFDTLASNNGVRQLHAHNAWIDIWFQLGVVGLVVFGALVLSTLARSWALATDRPQSEARRAGQYQAPTLLPLLVLVALLVQSAAESRLLVEFGMFFLVLTAVKTKADRSELVE